MRLPWLVLGLLGGVLSAIVIGLFEETLQKQLILAAFVPTIVYMADAVGSQSQMLFVRALSIEHNLKIRSYAIREFIVNFFIGIALSALIFIVSLVWIKSLVVSLILATSIFITVCSTVVIAIALPWFFRARGYDPAIASGPLSTVIHDGLSLCIYLVVASSMLSWWG
jgi:magnesium transporter